MIKSETQAQKKKDQREKIRHSSRSIKRNTDSLDNSGSDGGSEGENNENEGTESKNSDDDDKRLYPINTLRSRKFVISCLAGLRPIIVRLEKSPLKGIIAVDNIESIQSKSQTDIGLQIDEVSILDTHHACIRFTRGNQTQKVNVGVANNIRSTVELMQSEINQALETTKSESDSSVTFERDTNRDVSSAMEKVYHVQIHGKKRHNKHRSKRLRTTGLGSVDSLHHAVTDVNIVDAKI